MRRADRRRIDWEKIAAFLETERIKAVEEVRKFLFKNPAWCGQVEGVPLTASVLRGTMQNFLINFGLRADARPTRTPAQADLPCAITWSTPDETVIVGKFIGDLIANKNLEATVSFPYPTNNREKITVLAYAISIKDYAGFFVPKLLH